MFNSKLKEELAKTVADLTTAHERSNDLSRQIWALQDTLANFKAAVKEAERAATQQEATIAEQFKEIERLRANQKPAPVRRFEVQGQHDTVVIEAECWENNGLGLFFRREGREIAMFQDHEWTYVKDVTDAQTCC